jgi:hypothetical protein
LHIPQDKVREPLYVVTPLFNPWRYKARYELYRSFQKYIRESGAILVTVEAAFGEREYAVRVHAKQEQAREGCSLDTAPVPDPTWHVSKQPPARNDQDYIKVRAHDSIWLKENLINIGVQHLPPDWKYMAWVDADVIFARPDWVDETLQALQHYATVQMWTQAYDLTPNYEPLGKHLGFVYSKREGLPMPSGPGGDYYYGTPGTPGTPHAWHPGWAWGWRRDALDTVGGFLETGALGAGDNHMARSLYGLGRKSYHPRVHPNYARSVLQWQDRAALLKENVGAIDGLLLHYWHGRKKDRKYADRWQILVDTQFDPMADLTKDSRGVLRLSGRNVAFRDGARTYFQQRNEDSIDV